MGKTVKQSIFEAVQGIDLPHNVVGKPIPRSMMPQLKVPDLVNHDTIRITYPVDKIKPVQTDREPGLASKVANNFLW